MTTKNARAVAFYLPQFHPTPENDSWWGKGFTEWTNTAKAKPMFRGHYQPHVPADLGFYDLRVPETREQQAAMAREYGIEAFCYYDYWFGGGRRILERPFDEMVASGKPDFPFCVCWANESWTGIWHGSPKTVLLEQKYPGAEDHEKHFETLLPAFRDPRYLRVRGLPVFIVYRAHDLPDQHAFVDQWQRMARDAGLGGLHLVAYEMTGNLGIDLAAAGFDAVIKSPTIQRPTWVSIWESRRNPTVWARNKLRHVRKMPTTYDYGTWAASQAAQKVESHVSYPCVLHAWDNTPRSGANGVVLTNPDPEIYRGLLERAVKSLDHLPADESLVFIKSWNEWAEGNHLEPDIRNGTSYLQVVSDVIIGKR